MTIAEKYCVFVLAAIAATIYSSLPANAAAPLSSSSPVGESGVTGGLVVQLGCGDGQPAASRTSVADLRSSEKYLVHGLDTDAAKIVQARRTLLASGQAGQVSVASFDGRRLPYIDNLVQLLVVEDAFAVTRDEMLRVLSPGGVAMLRNGQQYEKVVKPWPANIDEWTHFLHGPDNNAVAADEVAGQPRSVQWMANPRWGRSHEELASMSAAVTSAGRIFYIADMAPLATVRFKSSWTLFARDAFSGVQLWTREIPIWNDHLRHFRSGPVNLPRRLAAIGDRVYATLGLAAPVSEIDAITGQTVQVFEGTEYTEEMLIQDGVLYLVVGTSETDRRGGGLFDRGEPKPSDFRYVTAIDIKSGKAIWKHEMEGQEYLLPLSLTVKGENVYYQSTKGMARIDANSGAVKWKTPRPTVAKRMAFSAPTIVATDEVLLAADREPPATKTEEIAQRAVTWGVHGWNEAEFDRKMQCTLRAYDVETGKELWSTPCAERYNSPVDVFVVDEIAWIGTGISGYDLKTGEEVRKLTAKGDPVGMPHHRCYRNKATTTHILTGLSGIEVVSFQDGWIGNNSWIRGTCQYGIMPANGLVYAPPDACACYNKTKVYGFFAAGPSRDDSDLLPEGESLLERGPAFGKIQPNSPADGDWTMFRADNRRSAKANTTVSKDLKNTWTAQLGGALTQPLMVGEQVFVASTENHSVYALDAADGSVQWTFTAGGRVDSSPTYYEGAILFGSADGWVYCLRASDGELAWRKLVAPGQRLVVAFGQLESAWPVHGSVMVQNDTLYVAAGRNSYLDGGISLKRIDPRTGEELSDTSIYHLDPKTGKQMVSEKTFDMKGVRPDILVGDGETVFMKHFAFDKLGKETEETKPHLFAINSLLEEEWFVRSYWMINTSTGAGWGRWASGASGVPSGRILSFDDDDVFGYGRKTVSSAAVGHRADAYGLWRQKQAALPDALSARRKERPSEAGPVWSDDRSLIVRAMVLTEDKLFVVGPPDLGKKSEELLAYENEEEALAGFRGARGVLLRAVAREDGETLAEYELPSMPAFDGLSAANGKLIVSLKDGSVQCWDGQ